MTRDIQYIIDHKSFKTEFNEYFSLVWTLLCLIPFGVIGYGLGCYADPTETKIIGLILGAIVTLFVVHVIRQFKHLNKFESIETNADSQTNFSALIKVMKILEPNEVDNDFRNQYLAFKLTKHRFPNWLTFIAIDKEILMNGRPNILAFWLSWNFKKRVTELLKEQVELYR